MYVMAVCSSRERSLPSLSACDLNVELSVTACTYSIPGKGGFLEKRETDLLCSRGLGELFMEIFGGSIVFCMSEAGEKEISLEQVRSAVLFLGKRERAACKAMARSKSYRVSLYARILKELDNPGVAVQSIGDLLKIKHVGQSTAEKILGEISGIPGEMRQVEEVRTKRACRAPVISVDGGGEALRVPTLFSLEQIVAEVLGEGVLEGYSLLKHKAAEHVRSQSKRYFGVYKIASITEKSVKGAVKWLKKCGLVREEEREEFVPTEALLKVCRLLDACYRGLSPSPYLENEIVGGVKLLVDSREKRSREDPVYFQNALCAMGIRSERRQLSLGDFVWVVEDGGRELFAELVVERKTIGDLVSSLRDGRFKEQKSRLERVEGTRIYVVEGSTSVRSLLSMVLTCTLRLALGGFLVLRTHSPEDTLSFLYRTHRAIEAASLTRKRDVQLHKVLYEEKTSIESLQGPTLSVVVLQGVRGISQEMAEAVVREAGTLGEMAKSSERKDLMQKMASAVYSGERRLGAKRAQRILNALGLVQTVPGS
jgi:ERCC4-type nuclease